MKCNGVSFPGHSWAPRRLNIKLSLVKIVIAIKLNVPMMVRGRQKKLGKVLLIKIFYTLYRHIIENGQINGNVGASKWMFEWLYFAQS